MSTGALGWAPGAEQREWTWQGQVCARVHFKGPVGMVGEGQKGDLATPPP